MKVENQEVANLELSKKLKELGVKQESLFYWADFKGELKILEDEYIWSNEDFGRKVEKICSAFTVAELGKKINWRRQTITLHEEFYKLIVDNPEKSEADIRAKWLIYLIENNLIKK